MSRDKPVVPTVIYSRTYPIKIPTSFNQKALMETAAFCERESRKVLADIEGFFNHETTTPQSSHSYGFFQSPKPARAAAPASRKAFLATHTSAKPVSAVFSDPYEAPFIPLREAPPSSLPSVTTIKQRIKKTAAYILLMDWLFEFYKNMVVAGASEFTVVFSVSVDGSSLYIQINDNGLSPIQKNQLGSYNLYQAILTAAGKIESMRRTQKNLASLSGKNMGLAIATHFLRTYGKGDLELYQRCDRPGLVLGTIVQCSSSMDPSERDHVLIPGENTAHTIVQFMREMEVELADKNDDLREIHRAYDDLMDKFHHPLCSEKITDPKSAPRASDTGVAARVSHVMTEPKKNSFDLELQAFSQRMRKRETEYFADLQKNNPTLYALTKQRQEYQNKIIRGRANPPYQKEGVWDGERGGLVHYQRMFPLLRC